MNVPRTIDSVGQVCDFLLWEVGTFLLKLPQHRLKFDSRTGGRPRVLWYEHWTPQTLRDMVIGEYVG